MSSFYADAGGATVFRAIAARFYEEIARDPVLRPLYPEEDLGPAQDRLRMYLEQYWGGPHTYRDQRGPAGLRVRHLPFRIGPNERAAWVRCMQVAVEGAGLDAARRTAMLDHLRVAATRLVNTGW